MSKLAAIYARFSTDLQNERSIEDQITLCRKHAAEQKFAIVATFEDMLNINVIHTGQLAVDPEANEYAEIRHGDRSEIEFQARKLFHEFFVNRARSFPPCRELEVERSILPEIGFSLIRTGAEAFPLSFLPISWNIPSFQSTGRSGLV